MTSKTTTEKADGGIRQEWPEQELRAGHLDDQQLARAEALDRARAVLAQKSGGFAPGSSSVDAVDLINVASWIVSGIDPWADQVDSDDVDQLAGVAKAIRECCDAIGRVIPGFWDEIPGGGYIEQCADLGAGPFSTVPDAEPTCAEVDSDDRPCPECGLGQTTPHSQHGQPDDDGDDQLGSVTA